MAFSNLSKNPVALLKGDPFCTCYFAEIGDVDKVLTREITEHLGRCRIGRVALTHARPERLRPADGVTRQDIEDVVQAYGTPWDIMRGALRLTFQDLVAYVDKEAAPQLVEAASSTAIKRAYNDLFKFAAMGIALLATLVAAVISLVLRYLR